MTTSHHRVIDVVRRRARPGVAGLVAIIDAFALMRETSGRGVPLLQGALMAIAVFTGWWALDHFARRDLAAERRALEARELDLATRALAPGSALACLDAIAGDVVEDACERLLRQPGSDCGRRLLCCRAALANGFPFARRSTPQSLTTAHLRTHRGRSLRHRGACTRRARRLASVRRSRPAARCEPRQRKSC